MTVFDSNIARVQYRVPIGSAAHRLLHQQYGPGDSGRELLMVRYVLRQDDLTHWETERPGVRQALAPYRWALNKQPWGSPGALDGLWFQPVRRAWRMTGTHVVDNGYGEQTLKVDFTVDRLPGARRPDEDAVWDALHWALDERVDEYAAVSDEERASA